MSEMRDQIAFWHYLETWTGCRLMLRPNVRPMSILNGPVQRYEMVLYLTSPMQPTHAYVVRRILLNDYTNYFDSFQLDELLDGVVDWLKRHPDLVPLGSQLCQQMYDVELGGFWPPDSGEQAETD